MKKSMMWVVGVLLFAGSAFVGSAVQAQNKDLAGNWQGTLQVDKGLRIVLKITKDDGKWKAFSYSIDQGGQATPVTSITLQGSAVNFSIKPLALTYVGTLNPDGNSISGSQTQGGETHALNFQRVTKESTWAIPEPKKPMAADAKPVFEVVTVKPSAPGRRGNGFDFNGRHILSYNTTVNNLITFAYGVHAKQVVDGPAWFGTEKFDIDGVPDVEGEPSLKQTRMLIQSVLVDRFQLKVHHDQRELSVYALAVGKNGPRLTATTRKPEDNSGDFWFRKLGVLTVNNMTMQEFCEGMQEAVMDKPVVDHTGLAGKYDFLLTWTPDETQFIQMGARVAPPADDASAPPSLSTALQEQVGLKLETVKANTDVIVIDHAEKPSAN